MPRRQLKDRKQAISAMGLKMLNIKANGNGQ